MTDTRDRIRACLAGVAIGFGRPKWPTNELPAGSTTDDWQLTAAVARSLIRCGRFDSLDQVAGLVSEYRKSTIGFGDSTTQSAKEIEKALLNSPPNATEFNHVAPLAVMHRLRHPNDTDMVALAEDVWTLGRQTHGDPRASYGAMAIAAAVWIALSEHPENIRPETIRVVSAMQERYPDRLNQISFSMACRLNLACFTAGHYEDQMPEIMIERIGVGCFAMESVPFSVAMAIRNINDFRQAILETVNCGGDTDTNASMVGAIVGANVGMDGIPEEWTRAIPSVREAVGLADQLYATFG